MKQLFGSVVVNSHTDLGWPILHRSRAVKACPLIRPHTHNSGLGPGPMHQTDKPWLG